MKIYYLIGWMLRPFAVIALHAYSYIFRTPRARVVVQNEQSEVLLVQSWLSGSEWGLPGGGVERNEQARMAATRELREEIGLEISPSALTSLFTIKSAGHDEIVFLVTVQGGVLPNSLPNRFEIKDARWFSVDNLPNLEPLACKIIERLPG